MKSGRPVGQCVLAATRVGLGSQVDASAGTPHAACPIARQAMAGFFASDIE